MQRNMQREDKVSNFDLDEIKREIYGNPEVFYRSAIYNYEKRDLANALKFINEALEFEPNNNRYLKAREKINASIEEHDFM